MKRKMFRRGLSAFLSLLMCLMTLLSVGTTVFAATTVDAYMIDFPRDGDSNYSSTTWGHSAASLMSGWQYLASSHSTVHCLGTYNGQVAYCIEPGIGQYSGDTLGNRDETYWENYPASNNQTISPDTVKVLLGRIMQYGYQGTVSTSWRSQNASDAASLSHILATQMLVWETVVGERDASFNHVDPSAYGKSTVLSYIGASHPLRSQIMSYYNSMVSSVQNHAKIPSFCARSYGSARSYELEYNGTNYSVTLTDTNGVLSNFSFSSSNPSVSFSKSGNRLTITADSVVTGDIRVTASKTNGVRTGVITWSDGNAGAGIQDVVTYGENVSDPVSAYLLLEMEAVGTMHLVKTSEDNVVSGIKFTISGNGVTKTVTTGANGTIDISDLIAGVYTVTEASIDRYKPQSSQQVTIVGGQTSTVTFNNVLKRGALEVTKSSEDSFVEGVKFHLYGTSLSGLRVDEYAVTNASGVARFSNVLISGSSPYTIEEVDTAVRYVIPDSQTVSIQWNEVAERSFTNILKKFTVTVTKTDAETGEAQGGATLAGAKYGIYKGGELVDAYYTDANGRFTSKEYICDTDWTVREIEPSEGYLLDNTVHKVGADPANYTIEHNTTSNGVTEEVIKGNIRLIKHIDAEDEDVEIVETPAEEPETPTPTPVAIDPVEPEETPAEAPEETPAPEASEEQPNPDTPAPEATEVPVSDEPTAPAPSPLPEESASDPAQESPEPTAATPADAPEESPAVNDPQTETESEDDLEPDPVPVGDIEAPGGEGIIEQPEEDARFQIYLTSAGSYNNAKQSERDLLITDSDGVAVSKELPYGRYTVHQIEGMEGQAFIPDFTVFINSGGQLYSYILNNQTISSYICVEKHDAETGKIIPAAGVGFQIKDLSTGEIISQTVYYPSPVTITTFFTADDGSLMLPYELPYGQYELIEVETCYGYVLDKTPVPFTVDGSNDVVTVVKSNAPQKGVIHIKKTGEVFSSVANEGSLYQPVYEIAGLAGATYTISALENIYTLDGTLRVKAGEVVDTITTGVDGASSKELYLGKYVVTETQAPNGMTLNSETQTVELVYAGQEVKLTEIEAGVYNERQHVEISLIKSMETDKLFDIGDNGELDNVTFGLYAAEKIVAADGSFIPENGLLEVVSVSAEGKAVCKSDLPFGRYYLQEIATDSHYLLSDAKYPVTFEYAGQETQTVKLTANNGKPIVNKLIYGSISGLKVDEKDKPLAGATIGLFAASETKFTKENALMTAVSGEDGKFAFDKVPVGNWIVREIEQPAGFLLADKLFPVTVTENEQVIEVKIVNVRICGSITLTKYDADYPENKLGGAVFEVYRDTNGNKEFDKSDTLIGTMEETSAGVYWMKDLEFGGIFVKEKTAPAGFVLDEKAYYVSIDTDGKTYEVENAAGKGFINQALKGSIKIIKTTSDGKKEGFAFRITGANGYDMTFTTDAKGEIFVDNLRVGEYKVTELKNSVSEGYKIADPVTVTLVANETLTVKIHNDKSTVDVPKTGDDFNLTLWISLFAVAAAGAGTTAFFYFRKRKPGKHLAAKK